MGKGHQFDPLCGRVTEDKLYAMAKHLLYEPHEKDPIFTQRAIKMLTQIFLAARLENQAAGYEKYRLLPYVRPLLRLAQVNEQITQAFASEELAGTSLDYVECRATLCQVEVTHDDLRSRSEFEIWFPFKPGFPLFFGQSAPLLPTEVGGCSRRCIPESVDRYSVMSGLLPERVT
jgi:hypothetical protein